MKPIKAFHQSHGVMQNPSHSNSQHNLPPQPVSEPKKKFEIAGT